MDINEYISSGILELYVAGALEPDEMREVEGNAARYPEIRAEIIAIEEAVATLARTDRNPNPELRGVIISRIAAQEQQGEAGARNVLPLPSPASISSPATRYMLAAAVTIAIISSALAIYYGYQVSELREEIATLRARDAQVVAEMQVLRSRYTQTSSDLAVLRSTANRLVEMKGLPLAPTVAARVYWNPSTKETYIDPGTLPAPPAGKQYQLWAMHNNLPVDAGVIDKKGEHIVQRMKDVAAATAFAVTLEPEGGRAEPTIDQMYVAGEL